MANTWNKDKLSKLGDLMGAKTTEVKKVEYPEDVMFAALADSLPTKEWNDYDTFTEYVNDVVNGEKYYPFRTVMKDKEHPEQKYWIFKNYIDIKDSFYTDSDNNKYPKKNVLSSSQFFSFIIDYVDNVLKGDVFVSVSLGYLNKEHKKAIQYYENDLQKLGATDIKNFVCVEFKKRNKKD
jgi:hypothetical protein